MYTFICEDNLDGIFTAIYDAWASHYGHKNIRLIAREPENYELFCEYIHVTTDIEKSQKVSNTIIQKCGQEVWFNLCQAAMADESYRRIKPIHNIYGNYPLTKADAIYRTILLAFSVEHPDKILDYLSNPAVEYVFELCRSTYVEAHHMLGFTRFKELQNHILVAIVHPKNYILPHLGNHFSDRFPMENFLIYDEFRKLAVIHKAGTREYVPSDLFSVPNDKKNFLVVDASFINQEMLHDYSDSEFEYEKLWRGFFESIKIEARANPKLQNQNIPKRFQKDAVEFQ